MADVLTSLGTEVRARRRALALTQQDLADLAGVSPRFIRNLEQGKTNLQLDSLLPLLAVLGLELTTQLRQPEA